MISVDLISFAAILLSCAIALGLIVRGYYDRRERLLNDHRRHLTVFHCIRCGKVYSRSRRREISVCPHCGFKNTRLKF